MFSGSSFTFFMPAALLLIWRLVHIRCSSRESGFPSLRPASLHQKPKSFLTPYQLRRCMLIRACSRRFAKSHFLHFDAEVCL